MHQEVDLKSNPKTFSEYVRTRLVVVLCGIYISRSAKEVSGVLRSLVLMQSATQFYNEIIEKYSKLESKLINSVVDQIRGQHSARCFFQTVYQATVKVMKDNDFGRLFELNEDEFREQVVLSIPPVDLNVPEVGDDHNCQQLKIPPEKAASGFFKLIINSLDGKVSHDNPKDESEGTATCNHHHCEEKKQ